MDNNRNTLLAVALSILVLIVWQMLYVAPRIEQERLAAEVEAQRAAVESGQVQAEGSNAIPNAQDNAAPTGSGSSQTGLSRDAALETDPRVAIETELLEGSINLKGARIDDLLLRKYRETIDPDSPLIVLLTPGGSENAYFAEFGYFKNKISGEVPGPNTVWETSDDKLTADGTVTLQWTNEKNIRFERKIGVDDKYMFSITDTVTNASGENVELTPYGRIARFGQPETQNIFVLHEGLIGVIGEEDGLQEIDYDDLADVGEMSFDRVDKGWVGITDKYWATAMAPTKSFKPTYTYTDNGISLYQSNFIGERQLLAAGDVATYEHRLFAGAKKSDIIDEYEVKYDILKFELMIDWGWFHFITKPLFWLLNWLYGIVGNFGFAILAATVIIKLIFLPLANMSYASMAKMKKVQPEMTALRERFADDKMKQQQEMMALYKREKINPAAGCWPILIQIPVFFALYKVLFVTIEMRQAPFIGWIQDLAAPDPTSIFNLFGLLPFEVGGLFLVGVWPLLMGITMFLQMQMNPAPPDPTQAMIFKWMPVVFTFMLATFPAGLVIYWAWNNFLSILQQGVIMRRHGTKIELIDNLKGMFNRKKAETPKVEQGDDKAKK